MIMAGTEGVTAERERVSSFVGVGCLLQAVGLLAPFFLYAIFAAVAGLAAGAIGAVAGLVLLPVLFVVGSRKASSWRCGNCKNPLASKDVRLCPVCHATLR